MSDYLFRPQLATLPVYQPGKPIEAVAREHSLDPAAICKLASNENPLGPSPLAIDAVREALGGLHRYPDGECTELRATLAQRLNLGENQFLFGNGSNELLVLTAQAFLAEGLEAIMGQWAFPVYRIATLMCGATPVCVPMPNMRHDLNALRAAITKRTRIVFLPSTDNPTGTSNTPEEVEHFVKSLPEHVVLVFDEAYAEFVENSPDLRPFIAEGRPILCTRTFSKIYGLAGLRIGYGYAPAALIEGLNRLRAPFNVNTLAQVAAHAALEDHFFIDETRRLNAKGRQQLYAGLDALGLSYTPSDGNFILTAVPQATDAFVFLQKRGIIVRPLPAMGDYLRLSVGTAEQNTAVLEGLAAWLQAS